MKKTKKRLILTRQGRQIIADETKKDFHTQHGFISKKDMKRDGLARTNKGEEVAVVTPSFSDAWRKIKRHAQIITPKDAGMITAFTGINRKSEVADLGSGSGALACLIAGIAKKVTTYDIDQRSIRTARENAEMLGLKNLRVKNKDCYTGVDERDIDVITADLPEPWKALDSSRKALKPGGFMVSYSPHITQSQRTVNEALQKGFIHLKTIELIEREWVVEGNKARPDFKGLGHTGFLTFLRKFG